MMQHDIDAGIRRALESRDMTELGSLAELEQPTQRETLGIPNLPDMWDFDARIEWLVEGLIPAGAVTLLTGESGVGKSTLALALCGAVAHGTRILGRETRQRTVLYLDRENPGQVVRERLHRLRIPKTSELRIWGGWVDPQPHGPNSPSVIEYCREFRPLVVWDSLVAFHTGSEQDASETRKHMQAYRNLAAMGATVLVSHHTGKAETSRQYRGSSDIKAAVDMAWLLESLGDAGAGLQSLRLTPFKSRLALVEPMRIDYTDGQFGVSSTRAETNREIMERVVRDHPDESAKGLVTLAQAAGVAKTRAEQLLAQGEREGWLTVSVGRRGRKTYSLASIEVML
jgi:hypothetical protein